MQLVLNQIEHAPRKVSRVEILRQRLYFRIIVISPSLEEIDAQGKRCAQGQHNRQTTGQVRQPARPVMFP